MEKEIKRRIEMLNKQSLPKISQTQLRGGMQNRLNRQESIRYGNNINKQKKKLKDKLCLLEKEEKMEKKVLGAFSTQSIEVLDDFEEPVFRRIRSRRGFFNE